MFDKVLTFMKVSLHFLFAFADFCCRVWLSKQWLNGLQGLLPARYCVPLEPNTRRMWMLSRFNWTHKLNAGVWWRSCNRSAREFSEGLCETTRGYVDYYMLTFGHAGPDCAAEYAWNGTSAILCESGCLVCSPQLPSSFECRFNTSMYLMWAHSP